MKLVYKDHACVTGKTVCTRGQSLYIEVKINAKCDEKLCLYIKGGLYTQVVSYTCLTVPNLFIDVSLLGYYSQRTLSRTLQYNSLSSGPILSIFGSYSNY